jgi:hypothetical protein
MRFDAERAAALAATFEGPRGPGTPALDAAADRCASLFSEAGLVVTRSSRTHVCDPPPASRSVVWGAIIAGLLLALTTLLARLLIGPDPFTLALGFGGLAALALMDRRMNTGHWWRRRVQVPVVEGRVPGEPGRAGAVRVVFVARLDSARSRRARTMSVVVAIAEVVWVFALVGGAWAIGPWFWLGLAGPWLMVALGVLAFLGGWSMTEMAPEMSDGRTGLAVLAEMARGWTGRPGSRLEPLFVALVAADPDATRAVLDALNADMIIGFEAPGAGPGPLVLAGPARLHAVGIATDLHVPAVVGGAAIELPTGFVVTGREGDSAIDAARLVASAQVAHEAVLRRAGQKEAGSLP